MQDRYVGDVGDFAKYALLRRLTASADVRLGFNWCLFPDEAHNNDGRHTSYLKLPEYADLDPELRSALLEIVCSGNRRISSIIAARVLPANTVFYFKLTAPPRRASISQKLAHRSAWINGCLDATASCALVFFDPDNGLEVSSIPKHGRLAGKYVYWDELAPFWERGQAILAYHHLNRTKPASQQIEDVAARFRSKLQGASVNPLVFRRGSCRVFWLVHHGCAFGRALDERAKQMLAEGWSKHFHPFGWPQRPADAAIV